MGSITSSVSVTFILFSVLNQNDRILLFRFVPEQEAGASINIVSLTVEQLESTLACLNDSRTYRRTVGSIVGSCVLAVTPLIVSVMQEASLVALDVIEVNLYLTTKKFSHLFCGYDIIHLGEEQWIFNQVWWLSNRSIINGRGDEVYLRFYILLGFIAKG